MSLSAALGHRSRTHQLDRVLSEQSLRSVFQPLVRLEDAAVVGYEVLSRGPRGHALESPLALLDAAREADRLAELDWAMRACGLRTAMELVTSRPAAPFTWFFNAESQIIGKPLPPSLHQLVLRSQALLPVVLEFTERSLTADPAGLLSAADQVRTGGWGVALDDVGADPESLALLPLVDPDVVKLDMRLIRQHRRREIATITNAVRAHCEDTGAVTLAEGIETEDDVLVAKALGATYGQGWHFGRPEEDPGRPATTARLPLLNRRRSGDSRTPYEVVADLKPAAVTEKRLLRPISRYLEDHVFSMRESLLVACFEHARFFTERIEQRYAELAAQATFTAALGTGFGPEPAPGVRGTHLAEDDPLALEWNVIVVGPHFAGALVARDLLDDGPDDLRRFEYIVTHDREAVLAAARAMVAWVTPREVAAA